MAKKAILKSVAESTSKLKGRQEVLRLKGNGKPGVKPNFTVNGKVYCGVNATAIAKLMAISK